MEINKRRIIRRGAMLLIAVASTLLCCYDTITNKQHSSTEKEQLHHHRRSLSEASTALVLSESDSDDQRQRNHWTWDIPSILSRAKKSPTSAAQQQNQTQHQLLRVLLITTSLVEYDKGTRGTTHGYDRLQHVMLPPLIDSVKSMTSHGWHVDVYLILGYQSLTTHRRQLIIDSLPPNVGLEIWEDAIPLFYQNSYNKRPKSDQAIIPGAHGLSRQHRYVLRDKLQYYDFFVCFEDDMRVTADHVLEFLETSHDIYQLYDDSMASSLSSKRSDDNSNGQNARVAVVKDEDGNSILPPPVVNRHKSNDGATVGNDIIYDPISIEHIQRLFPGLLRVEVLDRRRDKGDHPLRKRGALDNHRFVKEFPPSRNAFYTSTTTTHDDGEKSLLDPTICCDENDPPRGKMTAHPSMEEVVMWESKCACMATLESLKICGKSFNNSPCLSLPS